tara:strand:+ start:274 stop:486 length:213 start_codon:yes stop_codon:yes gene_type:complete
MSKMIPVEGHKNLFRDEDTGAILNNDNNAYQSYLKDKKRNAIKREEFDAMKNELEELKSLLNDLASKITS